MSAIELLETIAQNKIVLLVFSTLQEVKMAKVIEFKTEEEYNEWLQKKGKEIKIISVNTNKRWSLWTGYLGNAKTYTITYEEK